MMWFLLTWKLDLWHGWGPMGPATLCRAYSLMAILVFLPWHLAWTKVGRPCRRFSCGNRWSPWYTVWILHELLKAHSLSIPFASYSLFCFIPPKVFPRNSKLGGLVPFNFLESWNWNFPPASNFFSLSLLLSYAFIRSSAFQRSFFWCRTLI